MLKQAFAFAEIKDNTSAKLILQKLIKDHPKTQQAEIAKKKLATLQKN
jgi:TolA-binding protein